MGGRSVFAKLALPDAEDQPKISAFDRGRFSGISVDQLIRILHIFGRDVRIALRLKFRGRQRAVNWRRSARL
jgi:hypothetical protein